MSDDSTTRGGGPLGGGPLGFLLAQVGNHAAARFAQRMEGLGLSPAQVGLLRRIERGPGRSQQALANDLGVVPSRIVPLLDDLAGAGLIERRPSETDRRTYAVHLTERGGQIMVDVHRLAAVHSEAMSAGLSPSQRQQLTNLLGIVARNQGLSPGVHPGYRHLPSPPGEPTPGVGPHRRPGRRSPNASR